MWCESAWPGQAAHPAGSYTYSYLSYLVTARTGKDDINFDFDINIPSDITLCFRDIIVTILGSIPGYMSC